MKFIHVSDLHLGKTLHEKDLIDDQAYALDRMLEIAERVRADALLVAGDVYDRSVPPVRAIALFDSFIARALAVPAAGGGRMRVVAIPGNHDSGERLGWCSSLLARSGLHLRTNIPSAPEFTTGSPGRVAVWALPFLGPGLFDAGAGPAAGPAAAAAPGTATGATAGAGTGAAPASDIGPDPDAAPDGDGREGLSASAAQQDLAMRALDSIRARMDPEAANVLVAHCFVAGGAMGDSERSFVGAAESVDPAVFAGFDYVALGHLHRPQAPGGTSGAIRYSGAPLAYSFGESGQERGVFVVDVEPGKPPEVEFIAIKPKRAVRRIRAKFGDLAAGALPGIDPGDYVEAILTDEGIVGGTYDRLKATYPNILSVRHEALERGAPAAGRRLASGGGRDGESALLDDFREFFRAVQGKEPGEEILAEFAALAKETVNAAD